MFDWAYLDGAGAELGRSHGFDDPEAAEEWIGGSWQDLADMGVEAVVLYDHSRERNVYRMGLSAE
jgi:hypothetical protein